MLVAHLQSTPEKNIIYTHAERSYVYANDVISGKISACHWVKLACQRQIDDIARAASPDFPYYFDEKTANKVCKFIEKLRHIKGKWAGSRLKLEDWQCFIITTIFGWLRKADNLRRFRKVYVSVSRKNGKSALAAGIGLYMFTADNEPGAEIYSGATTEKQAWEVFGPARLMAKKDEEFVSYFGIEVNASNLKREETNAKFEPVIGKPGDGASPHCAIIDEYHEHKTSDLYDTMITGMGSRSQPLTVIITTAGSDLSCPCYDEEIQVQKILEDVYDEKDEEYFGIIFSIDKEDTWTDFNCWHKANPNLGVSVLEDFMRQRHKEAIQRASRQNIIRCKHLNQWVNAGTAYFNAVEWAAGERKNLTLDDMNKKRCWIAVDLASKTDLAEICLIFNENNRYQIFNRHYLPEAVLEDNDKPHYQRWAHEGFITLTPGNMIDIDTIQADIERYKTEFTLLEFAFDPWNSAQLAAHLQNKGVEAVQIPQTVMHLSEPMKQLEALIHAGKIEHPHDPVMTWMISNVMAKIDKKDNVFPFKNRHESKIDGAVAAIMALSRAIKNKKSSVYESRGIRMIGGAA